jgi:predicted transcriptional regulator
LFCLKVADKMTRIDKVFMLEYNDVLNFERIAKISKEGFSRIPIYEEQRHNIVGILHVKDFTLIDPDDNMVVKSIMEFYNHKLYWVAKKDSLQEVFDKFRQGETHMAFVVDNIAPAHLDPIDGVVGIITLEDVLEALVKMDIYDELDTNVHNDTLDTINEKNQLDSTHNTTDNKNNDETQPFSSSSLIDSGKKTPSTKLTNFFVNTFPKKFLKRASTKRGRTNNQNDEVSSDNNTSSSSNYINMDTFNSSKPLKSNESSPEKQDNDSGEKNPFFKQFKEREADDSGSSKDSSSKLVNKNIAVNMVEINRSSKHPEQSAIELLPYYERQVSHDLDFILKQQKDGTHLAIIAPQIRFQMFQILATSNNLKLYC